MGKHKDKHGCHDAEACYPYPPGAPSSAVVSPYLIESPQMRWAFIRKVYIIVAMQLMLTVAVAATVNLVEPIRAFFLSRTLGALIAFVLIIIAPIIGRIIFSIRFLFPWMMRYIWQRDLWMRFIEQC